MDIAFKQCTQADLFDLRALSRRTFRETFAADNTPAALQAHLDRAYALEKLRAELSNPYSQFWFLYEKGSLAGYLKLNEAPAQTELHDPVSLEIERIYVARAFQGHGLGGMLMARAIETAQARGKRYIWLGVWEKNKKARSFYQKHGFRKIGSHPFSVGDAVQTDDIMRKDLQ